MPRNAIPRSSCRADTENVQPAKTPIDNDAYHPTALLMPLHLFKRKHAYAGHDARHLGSDLPVRQRFTFDQAPQHAPLFLQRQKLQAFLNADHDLMHNHVRFTSPHANDKFYHDLG
jgi:hypothetical protein